jgi:SAM-dependent methyltransferase
MYKTETRKALSRRIREGFFTKYCHGKGIDIGCGTDPLLDTVDCWDLSLNPNHDGQYMNGVPDGKYDFVYSSHCLEDLKDPIEGIKNWWRILKRGGYLLLYLPHRDLFEHRKVLPSMGNKNHHWYFVIDKDEPPVTLGLVPFIVYNLTDYDIVYVKKCDEGYNYKIVENNGFTSVIANGEFSIEAVIRKGYDVQFV